jgi:excisionase family DNA binding protein
MTELTYTTEELAEGLHTSRNLIYILQSEGALVGIRKGKTYIYPAKEVDQFLADYTGLEISNKEAIQRSVAIVNARKAKTNG